MFSLYQQREFLPTIFGLLQDWHVPVIQQVTLTLLTPSLTSTGFICYCFELYQLPLFSSPSMKHFINDSYLFDEILRNPK